MQLRANLFLFCLFGSALSLPFVPLQPEAAVASPALALVFEKSLVVPDESLSTRSTRHRRLLLNPYIPPYRAT
ncbi:hypothetical protein C8J56DRAFT_470718 [Mycena floridula]|nr:hypothetical protein C8J56DRAFT_470718 [Mycena floridula]